MGSSLLWDAFQFLVGTNDQKARLLSRAVPQPCKILEIGCATGNIAGVFVDSDYTGIDTDAVSIETARRKFAGTALTFICGDVTRARLPAHSFDCVLLSHTAHHLPDRPLGDIILEASRVLKPDGHLVILDMQRPSRVDSPIMKFYQWIDRGKHFRTKDETAALVASCPFLQIDRTDSYATFKSGVRIIDQFLITARKIGQSGQR